MLKVSSDRLVKPGIEHATPGLQGKRVIYYTMGPFLAMRGSRNFRRGGGRRGAGPSDIKSSGNVIFCIFFFVLNLFYRSKMVISFSKVPEGVQHFSRRGFQLFPGGGGAGSNCLFHIETHISCDFQWGSGHPAPPPSGSAHAFGVVTPY